jgi:hypothetical protein
MIRPHVVALGVTMRLASHDAAGYTPVMLPKEQPPPLTLSESATVRWPSGSKVCLAALYVAGYTSLMPRDDDNTTTVNQLR